MIRTKLKTFLSAHDISVYELVQAVVNETEALSEASVYKIASGQRNPSLASLDIILTALTQLTNSPVAVGDVLEYTPETTAALLDTQEDEIDMVWQLALKQLPLEPITNLEPAHVAKVSYPGRSVSRHVPRRLALFGLSGGMLLVSLGLLWALVRFRTDVPAEITVGVGQQPPRLLATLPTNLTPALTVQGNPEALEYEFQVYNSDSGQELVAMSVGGPSFRVPPTYLCRGVNYAWTARVRTPEGWSAQASPAHFRLEQHEKGWRRKVVPPAPTALGPSGTLIDLTPTLRVSSVETASHYGFYIRDLTTDSLVYVEDYSKTPTHRLPAGLLKPNTLYRWNAQARNCAGYSNYSQKLDFRTPLR